MSTPGPSSRPLPRPARAVVIPAVGPRLRVLMWFIYGLIALLGANSVYLATVTFLSWNSDRTYENWFYMLMFGGHLLLGLVMLVPFLIFVFIHLFNTRLRKNKRAIRVGYALLVGSLLLLVSGILLMRIDFGGGGSVFVIKN
ncbi:MAG TPA: hypothetical protein VGE80_21830, partial [Schlesneria sp.]